MSSQKVPFHCHKFSTHSRHDTPLKCQPQNRKFRLVTGHGETLRAVTEEMRPGKKIPNSSRARREKENFPKREQIKKAVQNTSCNRPQRPIKTGFSQARLARSGTYATRAHLQTIQPDARSFASPGIPAQGGAS